MKSKISFAWVALLLVVIPLLVSGCQDGGNRPTVTFSEPKDGAQFNEGSEVTIRIGAVGGGQIDRIELSVDGAPYESRGNPSLSVAMQGRFTWHAIGTGQHTLKAVAYNDDGIASEPVSVTIEVK